jgi:flagellar hook-associated protein 1 FlgK
MGSITTALLNSAGARQVFERGFNVIENNVANANTPGYSAQTQTLEAASFEPGTGLLGGVLAGPVTSADSPYLDQAVRSQTQQLSSAQQQASDLSPVQPLFDTTGQALVPGALTAFFNSFSQLAVNPNDQPSRQDVITAAQNVAQQFNANAAGIQKAIGGVQSETSGTVAAINNLATQIASINQQYESTPSGAQNGGLQAELNSALDQLSQYTNYTALANPDGSYNVLIGGQTPLVTGSQAYAISAHSSVSGTVIADSQGNDITSQLQNSGSQNNGAALGSELETTNVTLPGYLSSLNTVAQTFADTVNSALSQGVDGSGNAPAVNLFQYNSIAGVAASLSVTNITPAQIAAASSGAPGGNGNALAVANIATQPILSGSTITEAYGNLAGQVGQDVANAQQEQTTQQNLVDQAQQQRSAASGVSLDAEAAQLIQFQQSYQAIGQLVTTLNSLTQTVINMVQG